MPALRPLLPLLAIGLLAACGGSGGGASTTPSFPADLPVRGSAPAPDGSTIPAGTWAVIDAGPFGTGPDDYVAIRPTGMVRGSKGDLGGVSVIDPAGGPELSQAVPYYVSYDYALLRGTAGDPVSDQIFAVTHGASDTGLATLSVPDELEECKTPSSQFPPTAFGELGHGCVVAVAIDGAVPTTLTIEARHGSRDVHFVIPTH